MWIKSVLFRRGFTETEQIEKENQEEKEDTTKKQKPQASGVAEQCAVVGGLPGVVGLEQKQKKKAQVENLG